MPPGYTVHLGTPRQAGRLARHFAAVHAQGALPPGPVHVFFYPRPAALVPMLRRALYYGPTYAKALALGLARVRAVKAERGDDFPVALVVASRRGGVATYVPGDDGEAYAGLLLAQINLRELLEAHHATTKAAEMPLSRLAVLASTKKRVLLTAALRDAGAWFRVSENDDALHLAPGVTDEPFLRAYHT